jgi:hypothetical protein
MISSFPPLTFILRLAAVDCGGDLFRIVADAMGAEGAEHVYAAWPVRYYVLVCDSGSGSARVAFKSMPDPRTLTYPLGEWEAAIEAACVERER